MTTQKHTSAFPNSPVNSENAQEQAYPYLTPILVIHAEYPFYGSCLVDVHAGLLLLKVSEDDMEWKWEGGLMGEEGRSFV
jgi:hypothetical protein